MNVIMVAAGIIGAIIGIKFLMYRKIQKIRRARAYELWLNSKLDKPLPKKHGW